MGLGRRWGLRVERARGGGRVVEVSNLQSATDFSDGAQSVGEFGGMVEGELAEGLING